MVSRYVELVGWGTTVFGGPKPNVPKKVTVSIVNQASCQQSYTNLIPEQICTFASEKDSCQYDSGGPVFFTDSRGIIYNIGVINHGINCASNHPSVNARVTSYLEWIKQNTASENYCYM